MTTIQGQRIASHNLEFGSGMTGIYMIHGFTGSTYELTELAKFLADNGFRVQANLLAGHGTTIKECNLVTAEDWLEETEVQFAQFMLECDRVFVLGLSMGAGLALHLGMLFPITGVIAMSVVLQIETWKTRLMLPVLSHFVDGIEKSKVYAHKDLETHPPVGYSVYPSRALRQVLRLNRYIRKDLDKIEVPVLLQHSHADLTADMDNAHYVIAKLRNTTATLIQYEHASHVLPDGPDKELVWQDALNFINEWDT